MVNNINITNIIHDTLKIDKIRNTWALDINLLSSLFIIGFLLGLYCTIRYYRSLIRIDDSRTNLLQSIDIK